MARRRYGGVWAAKEAAKELREAYEALGEAEWRIGNAMCALREAMHLLGPGAGKAGGYRRLDRALAFGIREHAKANPGKSVCELARHFGVREEAAVRAVERGLNR